MALLLFLLPGIRLHAQTKTTLVRGIVTSNKSEPLANVSVEVRNKKTNFTAGATTDSAGVFSFSRLPSGGPYSFSFTIVGYEPQVLSGYTVKEDATLALVVELKESAVSMDQVLVIGYGTQKKRDVTGSVSTIGPKDIGGRQTVQVSEALQGGIAGVSVTRSNGAPGAGSSILIRGITTIGNNAPLYIVDGVQVSNIDNVNPNDIENITVLKDAASAAIYGSRAAAGVVLVTTRRAKDGQSSFEYNYEYGIQRATALPKYVSAPEYMRYFNEQATNDGAAAGPYKQDFIDHFADSNRLHPDVFPFANTDWQDLILSRKSAPRQRHDLVFTAGTGKIKTKASLGYTKSDAFYVNNTYERYLFRVNNDLQINRKLGVNLDVSYKHTDVLNPVTNPISESRLMPAIYDDYYANGQYALGKDGRNPIAQLKEGGTVNNLYNQVMGRLAFTFKPVEGLVLTALVSPTFDFDRTKQFSKRLLFNNPDGSPSGFSNQARTTLTENRISNLFLTGQFLADYTRDFKGGHNAGLLLGYEELFNANDSLMASRSGFPLTAFPYLNSGSTELRDNSGNATESGLRSFFGRLKYDYKNKYYVQVNMRYDKSSRFGASYRGALFPSVSAGWTVSEEGFLRNIDWLSYLKIRGSYGEVGNERIGDYPYQATLSFTNALFYQNNVLTPQTGAAQQEYAVENISWETTRTSDIGLDAAFLNNRLTVAADYYEKRTYDILLKLDIPLYLGYDKPNQNAGVLNVKGWELEVGWRDRAGKLGYSVAFNISDARSTIRDLKGTVLNANGPQSGFVGSEYNEWFGYRAAGLYQSDGDTVGSPKLNANVSAGDVRYLDVNKDGKITPDDKVLLGGSLPRYLYGGNIRLDYAGFDLGLVFQGVGKKLSRLPDEIARPFGEAFGNIPVEMVGNFWSKNNPATQNLAAHYPRLSTRSLNNNYELSDFWLINGSYFRVKNITLGYMLKQDLLKKLGVYSLRVYLSGNDLFAIHHFPKYWDPELANASYPIVRTFMAGASIRF